MSLIEGDPGTGNLHTHPGDTRVAPVPGGGSPAAQPDDEPVDRLLKMLAAIPQESRDFTTAITTAERRFGLSPALLTEMVDLGLPAERRNGTIYFEPADLINLSFCFRAGTNFRTVERF